MSMRDYDIDFEDVIEEGNEEESLLAMDVHETIHGMMTLVDITTNDDLVEYVRAFTSALNTQFYYNLNQKTRLNSYIANYGAYIKDTITDEIVAVVFGYEEINDCLTYKDYSTTKNDDLIVYFDDNLTPYTFGYLKYKYGNDMAIVKLIHATGESL